MLKPVHRLIEDGRHEEARRLLRELAAGDGPSALYHLKLAQLMDGEATRFLSVLSELAAIHASPALLSAAMAAISTIQQRFFTPEPSRGEPDRQAAAEALKTSALDCGSQRRLVPEPGARLLAEGGCRLNKPDATTDRKDQPLVSIVTVCLNAADVLPEALQSVRAQTYRNVEHIVIDGASTDGTLDVLREHEDSIAYFASSPDAGIYAAMNAGLRLARGEYVALLNADDRLEPEFVQASLATIWKTGADITFCDYQTESGRVRCLPPNMGILFSQLAIKHNTFLCHRRVYAIVGGFDEGRRVVSDARWNRAAYLTGLKFEKVAGALVFYSSQGASAAKSDSLRDRIIAESASLLRLSFPFLSNDEAVGLYRSNFNLHFINQLVNLYRRYPAKTVFRTALERFILFNLHHRPVYAISERTGVDVLRVLRLLDAFEIPLSSARLCKGAAVLEPIFRAIDEAVLRREGKTGRVVLHFARRFSAPSETFIHDFLCDVAKRDSQDLHVFLCDERLLAGERPYDVVIPIPWEELDNDLRRGLYDLLWKRLAPTLVVVHFALNGFWLRQRLSEQQRRTPMIFMCHGIDVFAINDGEEYGNFMTNEAALATDIHFTAVSTFLRDRLLEHGVPEWKVHAVPNSVSPQFFECRKTDGFYRGDRPLELLCVGRLIDWKGHEYLIEALALLRDHDALDVRLTIVYGNTDGELAQLQRQAAELGVTAYVEWLPFVDFQAQPDFFSRFDVFVLASTYSRCVRQQSETFGVVLLEAIGAGLPVIGTTAGGIPEVLDRDTDFSRIVEHGSAEALRKAVRAMAADPKRHFRCNRAYAEERLARFSRDVRYGCWSRAVEALLAPRRTIVHFCALGRGGAAGATINIHRGFLRLGWRSLLVTREQERNRLPVHVPDVRFLAAELSFDFEQAQQPRPKRGLTMFSIDDNAIPDRTIMELVEQADIINAPWFARFLSVRNIGALLQTGKPVWLTVRDMYPLTGGCHYFHGCGEWQRECADCPQINVNDDGYPREVLALKKQLWARPNLHFVVLSEHSRDIVARSALLNTTQAERLPNMVDGNDFYLDRGVRRYEVLGAVPRFVLGYLPSFDSEVKGHGLLKDALAALRRRRPDCEIVVAVLSDAAEPSAFPFQTIHLPLIRDRGRLRKFYNAVDVVAVPSTEETFSNTTVEALACGCAVVGFETGVLAELPTEPKIAGVVPVGDVDALADEIASFWDCGVDRQACANYASANFNPDRIMEAYEAFAERCIRGAANTEARTLASVEPVDDTGERQDLLLQVRKARGAAERLSNLRFRLTRRA